jgi:hypothetical protein
VTGGLRIGTILTSPRHASVNQLRIVREEHIAAKPEPLHQPGPKAFDQAIGRGHQPPDSGNACTPVERGLRRGVSTKP